VIFCGRSVIAYEISFFSAFSLILACSETIPSPPHKTNDSHKDPDQPASHKQIGRGLCGAHFFPFSPELDQAANPALC
jgi:hypothetical protein